MIIPVVIVLSIAVVFLLSSVVEVTSPSHLIALLRMGCIFAGLALIFYLSGRVASFMGGAAVADILAVAASVCFVGGVVHIGLYLYNRHT